MSTTEHRGGGTGARRQNPDDASVIIESLATRNEAALAALAADNWRLLPDVLHTMHRTMADFCADAPLADPDFLRRLGIMGEKHRDAIAAIGGRGMDAVAQVLHHPDSDARAGACYAVQILGPDHAVSREVLENLGRLATEGAADDRGAAISALETLAKKHDFSPVQNALALLLVDRDPAIRWRAAKMIADSRVQMTDRECLEALRALLADSTKEVLTAGRDWFGGGYEPPTPDIPAFLHEVVRGTAQVKRDTAATEHSVTLTESGEFEKILSEALKNLPIADPNWVQKEVQYCRQAWPRHREFQGSFHDLLGRIMECCARDQQVYLAHPNRESNFYFQLCHHWIADRYDSAWRPGDNRLSFVCGLGGHNVWRTAVDRYVAVFHKL